MHTEPLAILSVLAVILTIATLAGRTVGNDNLKQRIRSWWWIVGVLGGAILVGRTAVILLFAGISFIALREFLALTRVEAADRRAVIAVFIAALPVQYLLVGIGMPGWLACLVPVAATAFVPV